MNKTGPEGPREDSWWMQTILRKCGGLQNRALWGVFLVVAYSATLLFLGWYAIAYSKELVSPYLLAILPVAGVAPGAYFMTRWGRRKGDHIYRALDRTITRLESSTPEQIHAVRGELQNWGPAIKRNYNGRFLFRRQEELLEQAAKALAGAYGSSHPP